MISLSNIFLTMILPARIFFKIVRLLLAAVCINGLILIDKRSINHRISRCNDIEDIGDEIDILCRPPVCHYYRY